MFRRLVLLCTLDGYAALAPLVMRLFVGFVLIYGTQDNLRSHDQMLEFRDFLAVNGFPFPLFSAYLSCWAQFICGVLIFLGSATRWAALLMVFNFIVALLMVHVGLPFTANISPLAMLAGALFLLLHGAGRWSVDNHLRRGRTASRPV